MLIRVQSADGQKRIECQPTDTTEDLATKIMSAFELEPFSFDIFKDRESNKIIIQHSRKTLGADYDLHHGDLIYMVKRISEEDKNKNVESAASSVSTNNFGASFADIPQYPKLMLKQVEIDAVDQSLMKKSGLIERKPDAKYCRHGDNARCVHCIPIEPYDEGYLKENKIQHMSFNSYLKKMQSGVDKGKFAFLENISCRIKPGCQGHLPWPEGICTKCQPSAITLNPQTYRHVDNITFENVKVVDDFINYWRLTGKQRAGFLYGFYDEHADVPLGIRAHVVAIYEPPQKGTRDSVRFDLDAMDFKNADFVAQKMGLRRIGWIFTDLVPKDKKDGTVQCLRNDKTYLLSAQECIMAGFFQNYHPNSTKLSSSGYFGSKFVTVCVTGGKDNQIHMEGYQVSNQCMALVNDSCLIPTREAPEFAYVLESSSKQYVPDVFYKLKDKYGNSVTEIARPLPVEYLLVDVPVSAPKTPKYMFNPIENKKRFAIENRNLEGHLQDFDALFRYLKQFSDRQFMEAMLDFHLLTYLAGCEVVPMGDALSDLLSALKYRDRQATDAWRMSEKWQTIEQLGVAHSAPISSSSSSGAQASASNAAPWPCPHCTFENPGRLTSCEMCGLPKDA